MSGKMGGMTIDFTVHARSGTSKQQITITQLIIAGWTGRDPVARDKHIAELEELGIARPASTPIYYRAAASRVTTAAILEATGLESSGEVEFVIVNAERRLLV